MPPDFPTPPSARYAPGYPDMSSQSIWGAKNLLNAALMLAVPIPSIWFAQALFTWFDPAAIPPDPGWSALALDLPRDTWVAFVLHHPILTVNVLFFLNVNLLFWGIALLQRNTWLIDPYWTLIPLFIAAFYALHPLAEPSLVRAQFAWVLLFFWSVRLTGNYFRRERARFGFREDWRFARMRARSRHFWWTQFFIVWVAQQLMLVGLTLPYWAVCFRAAPFGAADLLLCGLALLGIRVAHAADSQLDAFMRANAARADRGEPKVLLLEAGIWRYSRHPNYFGEQLFWWSVGGFGVVLGVPWVLVGTVLNSAVLAMVTVMQERRILEVPARRALYDGYRRRVSVLVPWFRRQGESGTTAGR